MSELPGPRHTLYEKMVEQTVEEHRRLVQQGIDWVREKWGRDRPCPYCGNPKWEVGAPLEPLVRRPRDVAASPAFPVMCTNCGNTVMINAILAGIVEPEEMP